ncbi:Alcohol acyl transferase 1 allele GSb [Euphorbia peplus]|nr:Alcohol acyl transferase 1 allele GSb [Euphorbia peplus]
MAEQLTRNPVEYALQVIRKAKQNVTREFIQSNMDILVKKGRPHVQVNGTYAISDARRLGFREVNFGWGNAIYGGPARAVIPAIGFYVPYQNRKGESGTVFHICLQAHAMDGFMKEAQKILPFMRLLCR